MVRASTLVLTAAVLAAVGCGDDTSAGTGGAGTGTGTDGAGGGGTGGDAASAGGGSSTSSSSASTASTGAGQGGGGGDGGSGGGGPALCGDGVVEGDEACDDGGESATCDVDCTPAACGDAVLNVTAGEACDEAGETAECDEDCSLAGCGDGTVNAAAGESCEDGNEIDTDACVACRSAACGDGFLQAGVEACDEGDTEPGDGCSESCQIELHPQCGAPYGTLDGGDRNVQYNDQGSTLVCDSIEEGAGWVPGWYRFTGGAGTMMANAPPPPYACGTHAAGWMNGEHPEVADGVVSRTACFSWTPGTCWVSGDIEVVNCGDFYLYNLADTPGCYLRYCGTTCGDGVVDAGEECDDGNLVDGDGCPRGCGTPVCGNGVIDEGEQCDDGGIDPGDGCSALCQAEPDPVCNEVALSFNQANRIASFNDGDTGNEYCDSTTFTSPDWQGAGWYRFTGPSGSRMPTTPPPVFSCQTDAPGWLNGTHPEVVDGIVTRQVCFNWSGNSCGFSTDVQVVNCGNHYRYNLPATPTCHLRYCGTF